MEAYARPPRYASIKCSLTKCVKFLLRGPVWVCDAWLVSETDYQAPGPYIRALLEEKGWTQRILGVVLGTTEQSINQLINGKRDLKPELAIRLGAVFGVDPQRFVDLQARYDLAQAKMFSPPPDTGLAWRAAVYNALPIAEMIRRRWIDADDVKQAARVEAGLRQLFGGDPADIVLPHAAKKTGDEEATPIQLAWLARVRSVAAAVPAAPYSRESLLGAVPKLHALLPDPAGVWQVSRLLQDAGVRFVVVEQLPGAKIDGVCTWLNDAPAIGMSLRLDRIDNFWFVLRHEIEHALRGHGRDTPIVDEGMDQENGGTGTAVREQERDANAAALDFCVPRAQMDDFFLRKRPHFYDRDIINFARRVKVHPGLVAGQLRHRLGRWNLFTTHLVPVRDVVARNSRTDGWGTVASITG